MCFNLQFFCNKKLLILGLFCVSQLSLSAQEAKSAPDQPEATTTTKPAAPAPDIYVYRQKGMRAMGDGFYDPAARFFMHYREAVQFKEPQFADATVLLVRAYLHQNKADAAQEALDYHQQQSKNLQDATYKEALQYWQGAVLLAQGKWQTAAKTVEELAQSSRTPEYRNRALELLGDAYIRLQEWDAAEKALQQLLQQFPNAENAVRAHFGLIKVFLATGKTEKTNAIIKTIHEKYTDAPALLLKLYQVLLYLQEDQLDDAYQLYRTIDAERPQSANNDWWTAAAQLSSTLLAAERYEDALTILPQVTVFAVNEDDRVQSFLQTAEAQIALEKVELAINTLETFRKNYPDRNEVVPVLLKLAELLRETGSHIAASEYFQKVAENEQAEKDFRYRAAVSRAWCFREAGQPKPAIQAFAAAAALAKDLSLPVAKQAEPLTLAGDTAFLIQNYTDAASYYSTVADNFADSAFAEKARLHQARAHAESKEFDTAATIYAQFLQEFPQSELQAAAQLEHGIALKDGGEFAAAREVLQKFNERFPEHPQVPRALMAAAQAARLENDVNAAIKALSTVITKHNKSDLYPHAIYQRANLYFRTARYQEAVADAKIFLEEFPLLPMATDVFMWLGDHYANAQELERSEEYFLKLITTHPRSEQAPTALYEAAKSAYHRDDLTRAALLIEEFHRSYADANPKVRAQAHILQGDIFAKQGDFKGGIQEFTAVQQLVPDTSLGFAALGRLGEMHYTLGVEQSDNEQLQKAAEIFKRILSAAGVSADVKEKARYRLAKTFEKIGNEEAAIEQYIDLIYQYDLDQQENKVRDWYYFIRSGYDVAKLFLLNERYRDAARIYEHLAQAGVPTADDMLAKAREIRKNHNMLD